jgi:hypothetical protein
MQTKIETTEIVSTPDLRGLRALAAKLLKTKPGANIRRMSKREKQAASVRAEFTREGK